MFDGDAEGGAVFIVTHCGVVLRRPPIGNPVAAWRGADGAKAEMEFRFQIYDLRSRSDEADWIPTHDRMGRS